jgi:hypothetical protein
VVTGSRHRHRWVKITLGLLHTRGKQPITHLILGCAGGVDRQALEWALDNGVFFVVFTADWELHGKAAGPKRNQKMVRLGERWGARCLGFPVGNSRGTYDCLRRALSVGLKTFRVLGDGRIGVFG